MRSYDELNALLLDGVVAYAKAHPHPEQRDLTIWQAFEAERGALVPYAGRFDGFHAVPAAVSSTCLVRFDNNKYSVMGLGHRSPVEVRAYAERIEIRQDGCIVAEHPRAFSRGQTVFDPWHYVTVLARKPGALRNGAPFKDWVLPAALERIRRSSPAAPTVTARWSGSSPPCSATACPWSKRPAPRHCARACTRPTWCSTSWPASGSRPRPSRC